MCREEHWLRLLTLYWKRKESSDRRATSPAPLVATCLATGVDSDARDQPKWECPMGFSFGRHLLLGLGVGRSGVMGAEYRCRESENHRQEGSESKGWSHQGFAISCRRRKALKPKEATIVSFKEFPPCAQHQTPWWYRCVLTSKSAWWAPGCSSWGLQLFLSTLHPTRKTAS